ncbi:MAG TPA: CHAD domain-containing protein [Candidatus Sulfotelmatobacter sp.]|nr:CHAD domain-containing protein [Candidatus Sulfotelmatobacter sp.]
MKNDPKPTGLRYWMQRVLKECDNVAASFSADPVHDLRVSLRRCRSMADGMMALDPVREWKEMKKAGKPLFRALGELRDVQIMMEWIDKLHVKQSLIAALPDVPEDPAVERSDTTEPAPAAAGTLTADQHDPASRALLHILAARETDLKHKARAALDEFDRKQWRQWSKTLPHRALRIRPGSAIFKHLALERWMAARDLQTTALRNRSQVALHTLRIGIKRFRYIVENFLPEEHKAWSNDLKHMQDLLGDIHDLDVLWATALSCRVFPDAASRKAWHARILEERNTRIAEYREKTVGPESLWNVWRAGLPQGKQVEQIATRRMKLWAKALDPDFAHSERVARFSVQLYDGLVATGAFKAPKATAPELRNGSGKDARASLYAAGLLHDVGKSQGNKGHHKESLSMIRKHGTPLGWKAENMARAAIIARFHCGALPTRSHKNLQDLLADDQKLVIRMAAILRLANALDRAHDGHIRGVKIEKPGGESNHQARKNGFAGKPPALAKNEALVIDAEGYAEGSPTAQTVAAERYLLETVLRRPVVVRRAALNPAFGPRLSASGKPAGQRPGSRG